MNCLFHLLDYDLEREAVELCCKERQRTHSATTPSSRSTMVFCRLTEGREMGEVSQGSVY